METIAHVCTEWTFLLIPALNTEIAHSLGKWDWFQLHISVTLPYQNWHLGVWMRAVSTYSGTCSILHQSLGPWYGTKHLIRPVAVSRESATGREGQGCCCRAGWKAGVSNTLCLNRSQSGNLGYSTWRTEFKGDMAQRGLSRPSLKSDTNLACLFPWGEHLHAFLQISQQQWYK